MTSRLEGEAIGGIYPVGATVDNQLKTFATTRSIFTQINIEGDAYNINTGEITLTNDTETPVLYFKNNGERSFLVTALAIGLRDSTGGAGMATPKVIRNPTGGTIVSGATNVDIVSNRNFGSNNTLTADIFKGATGNTVTGGTEHILIFQSDTSRLFASIDEVLPKGASLGINITPPTGNTSMTVYAAVIGHLIKEV